MQWIPSELYLLAYRDCSICGGAGIRREKRGKPIPCGCALRGVFRVCYARFRDCATRSKCRTQVSFDRNPRGRSSRGAWGRKEEEYIADFELISKRSLDELHYRVFRLHFLLGATWKLCCRQLRIDRGTFFHCIYRIEETLGAAYYQTEPYALYPPNEYFVARRMDAAEQQLSSEGKKAIERLLSRRVDGRQRLFGLRPGGGERFRSRRRTETRAEACGSVRCCTILHRYSVKYLIASQVAGGSCSN